MPVATQQQQSTAVVKREETAVAKQDPSLAMERVVVMGDLSQLSPDQRVAHYKATCQAAGVDWIARPFDYILVDAGGGQKKLVLYANQNCAAQIRDARNVSCKILSREKVGDLYIVTALATLPNGRSEEATGAVAIAVEEGEWKTNQQSGKRYFQGTGQFKEIRGADLANALMKCETKSKRRATFNLCGLGAFADEPQGETVDMDIRSGEENKPDPRETNIPNPPRAASPRFHTVKAEVVEVQAEAEPIEDPIEEVEGPAEGEPVQDAPSFDFPERLMAVLRLAVQEIADQPALDWSEPKRAEEMNRLVNALATKAALAGKKWSRENVLSLLWALHLVDTGEILRDPEQAVDYADARFCAWVRKDAARLPLLAEVAEWVRLHRE